ncbi:MAG: hypothetical protein V8S76_00475 [Lachnospiraceae bacterium]
MGFRKTSDGWFDFYISDDGEVKFKLEEGEDMSNIKGLAPGTHFMFTNYEWIVLDINVDGGVLAIMASTWNNKEYNFDDDGCNNYAKSSLRRKLLNELLPVLGEDNLIPHEVDMVADNGDDRYGTVTDRVFILSCDEYRKYRKHVPLLPEWMWTCTPWYISDTGHNYVVRGVDYAGYLNNDYANDSGGVAPACVFNPKKLISKRGMVYLEEKRNDRSWE